MNYRDIDLGRGQQVRDINKRTAVFLRRRCVHDNKTVAFGLPAEVAAKARIAARSGQAGRWNRTPALFIEQIGQLCIEPDSEVLQAYIVIRHYKGLRRP
ncbi:hypothetical protein D3C80_1908190 [compost metagenome]